MFESDAVKQRVKNLLKDGKKCKAILAEVGGGIS